MNQRRGALAEQQARRYLERRGLTMLVQNYRCRWGEIDLVMRDRGVLVFVEVRYRSGTDYGGALASVDQRKQRKLTRAALHYLQRAGASDAEARFDVLTVAPQSADDAHIEWLRNAFDAHT